MRATINEDGMPTGFFDEVIHAGNIPEEAIVITTEQWQECIENPGEKKFVLNGSEYVLEEYVPPEPEPMPREARRADFRTACSELGILESIEAAVASSNTRVQIAYQDATSFMESDPTVIAMGEALQFSVATVFDKSDEIAEARRKASLL
jgi:hypothetical protein